jgi:hypothetical protein
MKPRRSGSARSWATWKTGPNNVKLTILITGDELLKLQRFTIEMPRLTDLIGGSRRLWQAAHRMPSLGRRLPAGVIGLALKDQHAYPDKSSSAYAALKRLRDRLQDENRRVWD